MGLFKSAVSAISKPVSSVISAVPSNPLTDPLKGIAGTSNNLLLGANSPVGIAAGAIDDGLSGLGNMVGIGSDAKRKAMGSIPNVQKATYPGFKSYLDENYQLPSNMQLNPNTQAMDQLRNQALETGPSAWTQARLSEVQGAVPGQINQANQFAQGSLANAKNFLKSESGLSNSLSNQLDNQNSLSSMLQGQNLRQAANVRSRDLMLGDAQAKETALNALPGMELNYAQPGQTNITNTLNELTATNAADVKRYQTEMESWARANTAGATASSGKK